MKVRNGFVSNSSSSSFICPMCETIYEVMDGDPTGINCLNVCERGHGFCMGHTIINKIYIKFLIEFIKKNNDNNFHDNLLKHLNEIKEYDHNSYLHSVKEISAIIYKLFNIKSKKESKKIKEELYDSIYKFSDNLPSCLCPICQLDVITDYDICRWLNINKKVKEKIIKDIKEYFNNHQNFEQYLRDNHENS